jgi:Amt family ammonium transporter
MLSIFLGPRRGYGTPVLDYRPQSTTLICLGTSFICSSPFLLSFLSLPIPDTLSSNFSFYPSGFGWLAFNGASMSAMNLKSISCVVNSNIAASSGALAWTATDFYYTRTYSASGICSGVLAGLIGCVDWLFFSFPLPSIVLRLILTFPLLNRAESRQPLDT